VLDDIVIDDEQTRKSSFKPSASSSKQVVALWMTALFGGSVRSGIQQGPAIRN
jgi:hypothetical protein